MWYMTKEFQDRQDFKTILILRKASKSQCVEFLTNHKFIFKTRVFRHAFHTISQFKKITRMQCIDTVFP